MSSTSNNVLDIRHKMYAPITVPVFMNTFILSFIKTHMTAGMYVTMDSKSVEKRIQLTT